jgi:hypothetical protein
MEEFWEDIVSACRCLAVVCCECSFAADEDLRMSRIGKRKVWSGKKRLYNKERLQ